MDLALVKLNESEDTKIFVKSRYENKTHIVDADFSNSFFDHVSCKACETKHYHQYQAGKGKEVKILDVMKRGSARKPQALLPFNLCIFIKVTFCVYVVTAMQCLNYSQR
jgi:hypothetical protein